MCLKICPKHILWHPIKPVFLGRNSDGYKDNVANASISIDITSCRRQYTSSLIHCSKNKCSSPLGDITHFFLLPSSFDGGINVCSVSLLDVQMDYCSIFLSTSCGHGSTVQLQTNRSNTSHQSKVAVINTWMDEKDSSRNQRKNWTGYRLWNSLWISRRIETGS